MITVPKRPLVFVLPYHGPLSFETKTILRKFFNSILICCKLLRLRIKTPYQTLFVLNITFPKSLHLVLFINFSVDSAMNHNYDECARHLNARAGEHNGISLLTKTKVKPKGMVLSTLQKQNTMICHDNTSTPVKKYHDIYREKNPN